MSGDEVLFQVPGTDNKGHSVQRLIRMAPQLDMQIETIITSKKFPYRTWGELVRHALVRHFEWLEKMTAVPHSMLPQIKMVVDTKAREEQTRELEGTVDKVVQEVEALIKARHKRRAEHLIEQAYIQIEAMRKKDAYWGEQYHNLLRTKLSHIQGVVFPKPRLRPSEFDTSEQSE